MCLNANGSCADTIIRFLISAIKIRCASFGAGFANGVLHADCIGISCFSLYCPFIKRCNRATFPNQRMQCDDALRVFCIADAWTRELVSKFDGVHRCRSRSSCRWPSGRLSALILRMWRVFTRVWTDRARVKSRGQLASLSTNRTSAGHGGRAAGARVRLRTAHRGRYLDGL